MEGFLQQPSERRRLICEQAEEHLNLPAISLEKDFWVCWILGELFDIPVWGKNITFKGGTSLSKCWSLISRFSEDIDIVIDREFLGFGGDDSPEKASSKKKRKKRLAELKSVAQHKIHSELGPLLKERISTALPESDIWKLSPASREEDPGDQTILFNYPTALDKGQSYIRRVVKIELGARSDSEPVSVQKINPYLFEVYPDILGPTSIHVRALAPERTFWEKAMLLHEERCRPPDKKRKPRMARHYYDLWCLITKGIAAKAAERMDIFERAAYHREIYFRWSWMDYSTLAKGKLQLVPFPDQEAEWRRDYNAMGIEMFFGKVPEFSEILQVTREFQDNFNSS